MFALPLSEQRKRPHFAALLRQRRRFQFLPGASAEMRPRPPRSRLLKYASALHAVWRGVDQYSVPVFPFTFMRILPRTARVNLSDIVSEVAGVIDCGSNGKRKSGGPDINIPRQLLVSCERAAAQEGSA